MSEPIKPNYCKRCNTYSVLPNHCDNCGGKLSLAPITWRSWWETTKLVLLLIAFFFTGVVLGAGMVLWRQFTR